MRPAFAAIVGLVLVLLSPMLAQAREDITNYHVAIEVRKDRSVIITETIDVNVEGLQIKRGLLRDIPVRYRDLDGGLIYINPDILAVKRGGQDEPYEVSHEGRYWRIKIGRAEHFLKHGIHRYVIKYSVKDSIGFFEEFDEIYWNAIGTEWPFWIQKAIVSVQLPEGAVVGEEDAYTGFAGAKGKDFRVTDRSDRRRVFQATRGFAPGEGMTVVVNWQKGVIAPPTEAEQTMAWMLENSPLLALFGFGSLQLGWFALAWARVGRDPEGGAIIARFRPPKDISPALASYISGMGSHVKNQNSSFSAALISLAIKGFVSMDEQGDDLKVKREKKTSSKAMQDLPPGEKALFSSLMGSRDTATFAGMTHSTMSGIMSRFESAIEKETDSVYFNRNTGYVIPGILLAIAGLIAFVVSSISFAPPFMFPIMEIMMFVAVASIIWNVYDVINGRGKISLHGFAIPLFILLIFGFFGRDAGLSPGLVDWPPVAILGIMGAGVPIFAHLMKAPTKLGQEVIDEVEGLKLFMTVTVAEQADLVHDADMPELTPQLYEDLLPYAVALGAEKRWSAAFEDKIFSQLPPEQAYRPHWYHGSNFNPSQPTAALTSMTSTLGTDLASAMTPPASSSSGSGGVGFSGGGGGGGGGGGW